MKALDTYRHFIEELVPIYGKGESEAMATMVFAHIARMKRAAFITEPEKELEETVIHKLNDALTALKNHVPVQYVTGEAWFNNMKFTVSDAVLIPRPETEELTAMAMRIVKLKKDAVVLDIGTGSGCIAISIKKRYPLARVYAIDVSAEALEIAKMNAEKYKADINFIHTDFLEKKNWSLLPKADLIVSNPPYIPWSEKESLDQHVAAHEPELALFVPTENPLIFYKKIAEFGKRKLQITGSILMETHESMADDVSELFKPPKYISGIEYDMFGKKRMVCANHCLTL